MKKILFLFPILLLSCSPQKRLASLVKDHPELVKSDTVYKTITVISPSASHDTIIKNTITKDTVVIRDHQLTIKYFNDGKAISIKGKCDTVKIPVKIPVIVNTVTPAEKYIPDFYFYSTLILYILLLLEASFLWFYFKYKR